MQRTIKNEHTGVRRTANRSIGDYLIQRLQDYGVRDIFGIPGDYVLAFYSMLEESPLNVIGCTREDCAGFAADGYARLHGMGAVCVTYCVGGLSVCNSIAGAFAEKSPIVVISGAPGLSERFKGALLHHQVRDFRTQFDVFEKFTIAATELTDPLTAFSEIDRVLDACNRFKRPVYIELPRDMVFQSPPVSHTFHTTDWKTDPKALAESVAETIARLRSAKKPVIIAGVELHRFGLQDEVLRLAEKGGIPIATTVLGKSVVGERHPLYIGVYGGALGREEVTQFVEESDLILLLGAFMTDINLGVYTANLDAAKCVYVTSEQMRISHHHYHDIALKDFLVALADNVTWGSGGSGLVKSKTHLDPPSTAHRAKSEVEPEREIKIERIISMLDHRLDGDTIVIADVGDALFAATELVVHEKGEFLSPAYYTSMGFSVPAALGASIARPDHRIVVLVGDGAFQMTGQELSTLVRMGCSPILIVLNNGGYGTERYLQNGSWAYNDIHGWAYHKLIDVYGGGRAYEVRTEGEFALALDRSWDDRTTVHLLHVYLPRDDASRTLRRLAERLGARVGKK